MTCDIDNNLTIILVLKDRVEFTYRWMEYVNSIKLPFKVIIVDGGADKVVEKHLLDYKNYSDVDYQYYRYPYDATYLDYYTKLASAFTHVTTDYVALADNDDFFVINGLRKSVDFLMKNPDYASCGGEVGGLFFNNKEYFEFGISAHIQSDNNNESAIARVERHLNCYNVTHYDVHRTEQLRMYFNELKDLNPSDLFISEILTSSLVVASGKVKKNKYLYLIRQNNSPGSGAASIQARNNYFGRMFTSSWSKDFISLSASIVNAISKNEATKENGTSIVNTAYTAFLLKNIHSDVLKNVSFIKRAVAKYILKSEFLCQGMLMKVFLRKIYSIFCRVKYKDGNVSQLGRLLWFYNDVTPIAKVLHKS